MSWEGSHCLQRGFGAMAALPRVDRFCYFRTLLARVGNVLEAATAPSPGTLAARQKTKPSSKRLNLIYLYQQWQDLQSR
jgi:hypothetical protein